MTDDRIDELTTGACIEELAIDATEACIDATEACIEELAIDELTTEANDVSSLDTSDLTASWSLSADETKTRRIDR